MPWKESTIMEQKIEFICEWRAGNYTITQPHPKRSLQPQVIGMNLEIVLILLVATLTIFFILIG